MPPSTTSGTTGSEGGPRSSGGPSPTTPRAGGGARQTTPRSDTSQMPPKPPPPVARESRGLSASRADAPRNDATNADQKERNYAQDSQHPIQEHPREVGRGAEPASRRRHRPARAGQASPLERSRGHLHRHP